MKKKNEHSEKLQFDSTGYQVNMKDLNGEPLPDLAKLSFQAFKHGGTQMDTVLAERAPGH
jgi:hypothetical protein